MQYNLMIVRFQVLQITSGAKRSVELTLEAWQSPAWPPHEQYVRKYDDGDQRYRPEQVRNWIFYSS